MKLKFVKDEDTKMMRVLGVMRVCACVRACVCVCVCVCVCDLLFKYCTFRLRYKYTTDHTKWLGKRK